MPTVCADNAALERIRESLAWAPVGILVLELPLGNVAYANAMAEQLLGLPGGGLAGKTLPELMIGSEQGYCTELLQRLAATPTRMAGTRRDLYARHARGEELPVELTLSPIELDGVVFALVYMTAFSEAQRMQLMLEPIFAAMPQGMLLVDASGIIMMSNPALEHQFGYARGDLNGRPLEMLLPERVRGVHARHMLAYLENPVPRHMGTGRDLTGLHRNGSEFPVEVALAPVQIGRSRQLMAVVSDISVRKRAEQALRQTNAQLEEFTYVASHDLRAPLRGIADLIGWIREDLPAEVITPTIRHNFERVELRIGRCEHMIEDLLEYARAGGQHGTHDTIEIGPLIEEVMEGLAVPDRFRVVSDLSSAPFQGARTPLALVLRNLLANAVKHHGEGTGQILITAHDAGRFAVITIEDDGPGIPQGAEERIFKLFHRASPDISGYGVGLAVSRRVIEAHGGSIAVERGATLGGACFRVHWPRVRMKEATDART